MLERWRNSLTLTYDELVNKVTWPSWAELQSSAIATLVASLLISLIVFGIDSVFKNLFQLFYDILS